jgi:hypothetical protein
MSRRSDARSDTAKAATPREPVKPGFVRMLAPAGSTHCSFDGETYSANAAGLIDVPRGAAEPLAAHGYTRLADGPPAPPDRGPQPEE